MKLKKIDPNWYPSGNRELKVGETIEITDPKALILAGQAVAVDENGVEISAYNLYGVITGNEKKEFEEWLAMKKQNSIKENLEKQQSQLKEELTSIPTTTVVAENVKTTTGVRELEWTELQKKARDLGVYKPGMKREEVEAAVENKVA